MIDMILPSEVATAVSYDDPADASLFPEEESVIARAVDKRRREFTTVRWCARRAMADLGLRPAPIVPGEKGAPRWPEGVVGSMTHCEGFRAAAIATTDLLAGIGIDAEPHAPLPDGVLDLIAVDGELPMLRELARQEPTVHWDRVLFCAKESVFKAWFPVTRRWLGFEDACVSLELTGTFTARILLDDSPYELLHGRWVVGSGLTATAIAVSV